MILAAGFGQRLRPHTEFVAKPALPLLNVPMLGYSLYLLEQAGLNHLAVNTHHLPETIQSAVTQVAQDNYQVEFFNEAGQILGSGGGIKNAQRVLAPADDFFVLNGDNICLFNQSQPLKEMLDFHRKKKALATIMVCHHPEVGHKFGGIWLDQAGKAQDFGKSPKDSRLQGFHFTGILLLSRQVLERLPSGESNILYDVLLPAIQEGEEVWGYQAGDIQWFETGNEQDYLKAHFDCLSLLNQDQDYSLKAILKRFNPAWNEFGGKGLISASPVHPDKGLNLKGPALIGRGVEIDSNIQLDNVVIGDNCHIGSGCRLSNTVIYPGVKIQNGAELANRLIVRP